MINVNDLCLVWEGIVHKIMNDKLHSVLELTLSVLSVMTCELSAIYKSVLHRDISVHSDLKLNFPI
jgi:hypothetical protein